MWKFSVIFQPLDVHVEKIQQKDLVIDRIKKDACKYFAHGKEDFVDSNL